MTFPADDGFSTRAIHVGQQPDATTGAVVVPIYQTSTYAQDAVGQTRAGYDYSRAGNPTRTALETALASLELGRYGSAFASGMAAADTALRAMLRPGDHLVIPDDAYGGSFRLIDKIGVPWGLTYTAVPISDVDAVRAAVRPNTRMIWAETPTNPLLTLADIAELAKLKGTGRMLAVDNTFASPYFQSPLALGADIVVHSTTKYIGGHSDVVGGAAISNDPALAEALKFHQNALGGVPGPFDAWLVLRGAKTLALRMREHERNARDVAAYLEGRDDVAREYYPGLASHPQHALAKRQMRGFGGMVSCVLRGDAERAFAFAESTKLFSLAESLGGVESLISIPARMTHGSIPKAERERRGVTDGLLRLSVGIEDSEDLIEDLRSALDATAVSAQERRRG